MDISGLVAEGSFEIGMRYRSTRSKDDVYEFELDRPHQGHEYYYGASGSPIADETGQIVSLLLGGDPQENLLFGVPLARFNSVLGLVTLRPVDGEQHPRQRECPRRNAPARRGCGASPRILR